MRVSWFLFWLEVLLLLNLQFFLWYAQSDCRSFPPLLRNYFFLGSWSRSDLLILWAISFFWISVVTHMMCACGWIYHICLRVLKYSKQIPYDGGCDERIFFFFSLKGLCRLKFVYVYECLRFLVTPYTNYSIDYEHFKNSVQIQFFLVLLTKKEDSVRLFTWMLLVGGAANHVERWVKLISINLYTLSCKCDHASPNPYFWLILYIFTNEKSVSSGFIAGALFQLMHSPYWILGVSSAWHVQGRM